MERGCVLPPSLPVVHNQLLCSADGEMEGVDLAPRCQGSDLLSVAVSSLLVFSDGCVVSKLDDGVGAVGGHAVMLEQGVRERAEHAALRGVRVGDVPETGVCVLSQTFNCDHNLSPTCTIL